MDEKDVKKQFKLIKKYMCEDLDGEACEELKKTLNDCSEVRIYYDTMKKTVIMCKECECTENIPADTKKRLFECLGLEEYIEAPDNLGEKNE